MKQLTRLRRLWRYRRGVGAVLLGTVCVIGLAFAVNSVGIQRLGGVHRWQQWLQAHTRDFLLWRLCLYALTAYVWWQVREQLRRRESTRDDRRRLARAEIAAVVVLLLLEGSQWLQHG